MTLAPPNAVRRLGAALALVCLLATGCAQAPEVTTDDAELELGRTIWSQRCATCHAPDGGGGSGPKLNDGRVDEKYPNVDDQVAVVVQGRKKMPSFSTVLSEDEIVAVVRYTREVSVVERRW